MKKTLEERIEEAVREEVVIAPPSLEWPVWFEKERDYLRRLLPAAVITRIEHFGSTAVPGLAAKPVIDILVGVSSLTEARTEIAPLLEAAGYDYFWRTDCEPPYAHGLSSGMTRAGAPIICIWWKRTQSSGSDSILETT